MAQKVRLRITDPVKSIEAGTSAGVNKTSLSDTADARDILSMFVGAGHTSLADRNVNAHYTRLANLVGVPLAQKLTNQAFLFNQRPDVQKLNPEQRVQNFFDLGSNDPDVHNYLMRSKGIGYGQAEGFRNSPLVGNRALLGKDVGDVAKGPTDIGEKLKLIVNKGMK